MGAVGLQIAGLVGMYLLGASLRHYGRLGPKHGGALLRLVVNLGLPPLTFSVIHSAELDARTLGLPLLALAVVLVGLPIGRLCAHVLKLDGSRIGSLVLCTMSVNVAFTMPFVLVILGPAAFATLVLFDIGNAIAQWTLTSFVAAWHGGRDGGWRAALRTMLTTLPFWAIPLGFATNVADVPLPPDLIQALRGFGQAVILLVPFAMGVLSDLRHLLAWEIAGTALLRSATGLVVALIIAGPLGLEGNALLIATIACAAPIGFTAVVIASRDRLDVPFVANASSLSILCALVWLPLALLAVRSATGGG